jgi:hypothetical protein
VERAVDGRRPVFPEDAVLAQLIPEDEDLALQDERGAIASDALPRRTVAPLDPVESLSDGSMDPPVHRADADAESLGHGTE